MLRLYRAPRKVMPILLAALAALSLGLATPALAQGPGGGPGGHGGGGPGGPGWHGGGGGPGWHGGWGGPGPGGPVSLPPGHLRVVFGGVPYFFWGGQFYLGWQGVYVPVLPPVGLVISVLPPGFQVVVAGGINYYLYDGIYYQQAPGGYVVVSPPAAASSPVVAGTPTGLVAPAQGASGAATVIAQALNVRSGPGMAYPVLQVVNLGADLTIQGRTGSWVYVKAPNGDMGWVSQEFVTQSSVPASG